MTPEEALLVEQVTSAHRERTIEGEVKGHPAFYDLDAAGRREAFEATLQVRQLEAASDPEGLSSSAHAILARITRR